MKTLATTPTPAKWVTCIQVGLAFEWFHEHPNRNPMMLLTTALALLPATPTAETVQIQAAVALEFALGEAQQLQAEGRSGLGSLQLGLRTAIQKLGPDSENGARLQRLNHGARFKAYMADGEGAAWLQEQLPLAISDLRFTPVLEADVPEGFPQWTPVGEIQIQRYPAYRMARTAIQRSGTNGAFWKLFGHIKNNEIAMTAPVETRFTVDDDGLAQSSMAFLYGSQAIGQTDGEGKVQVVDMPAQVVLSTGMRGFDTPFRVSATCTQLEDWLRVHPEWTAAGPPRTMVYNGPSVFGNNRYFEVQYPVKPTNETMINFTDRAEAQRWRSVDDAVMGGRSASRMKTTSTGHCMFTGDLSIENNGGFASIRRAVDRGALDGASHVALRVRGDGNTYQLRFRTSRGFNAASYQAEFDTVAGEWINVELELASFELKWRGRSVRNPEPLDPSRILGMGLLIANKQVGSFQLELESLSQR